MYCMFIYTSRSFDSLCFRLQLSCEQITELGPFASENEQSIENKRET